MKCSTCGYLAFDAVNKCPKCGASLNAKKSSQVIKERVDSHKEEITKLEESKEVHPESTKTDNKQIASIINAELTEKKQPTEDKAFSFRQEESNRENNLPLHDAPALNVTSKNTQREIISDSKELSSDLIAAFTEYEEEIERNNVDKSISYKNELQKSMSQLLDYTKMEEDDAVFENDIDKEIHNLSFETEIDEKVNAPALEDGVSKVGANPASIKSRLFAFGIDIIILNSLLPALLLLIIKYIQPSWPDLAQILPHLLAFILMQNIIYFTLFHGTTGQTLGKMFMKIKVEQLDGKSLGFSSAFLRVLGYIISAITLGFGFFSATQDKKRRAWHDKIAHTSVNTFK